MEGRGSASEAPNTTRTDHEAISAASRLWIRCDASQALGLGHLMRSIALAEEATGRGLAVSYVMVDGLGPRVARQWGFPVILADGAQDRSWLELVTSHDLVFFDGYHFGPEDFRAASDRGARTGAVDDLGSGAFEVDVLLNQNPSTISGYEVAPGTTVLLGPSYALVRREFRQLRRTRAAGRGRLVLTFGGTDPTNAAAAIVRGLDDHRIFDAVTVVVGPGGSELDDLAGGRPWLTLERPSSVAAAFDEADAVISAAGSTTWELLCMGLPVGLVQVAENQRLIGAGVAEMGAALFLGSVERAVAGLPATINALSSPDRQAALRRRALAVVDGRGAQRVLDALLRP